MKVPFYILGLLIRYGSQSGYSLKQIIESEVSDFAKIKLSNIYYHLDKLKAKEYVSFVIDKDSSHSEKTLYSITDKGREYFSKLFSTMLQEDVIFEFPLDGILYFADSIDNNMLITTLKLKEDSLNQKLKLLELHKESTQKSINKQALKYSNAIFNHHILHYKAELSWIRETIKGLK